MEHRMFLYVNAKILELRNKTWKNIFLRLGKIFLDKTENNSHKRKEKEKLDFMGIKIF